MSETGAAHNDGERASASTSRPLAVHSLDHFTFAVPDLAEAEHFYRAFGLDVGNEGKKLRLRTFGSDHVWAEIVPGDRKRLLSLSFGIFEEDAPHFARMLADIALDPPGGGANSLWCRSPDGAPIELKVAAKSSPGAKGDFVLPDRYSPQRGTGSRSRVAEVRPRRLAHLALFVSDVPTSMAFFDERLGLRLSDRSGDNVAFMHGPHGSDHHMIAIGASDGYGMHHCSWDVASIDEIGRGAAQMAAAGYSRGWGLGRHVLGSNYFHYVRDPWGSYCEYSGDMDFIGADEAWAGGDHPGEDSFYQWGPPPPEDFNINYETRM